MRGTARSIVLGFLALGLSIAPTSRALAGFGWEFTYQGELENSGALVNGAANMTFKLFNAAAGGSQVGPTLTKNGVPVTDGRFTVGLDFTNGGVIAGIFDGNDRWLEIAVEGTTLAPRQELTVTPHAAVSSLLQMPYGQRTVVSGSAFFLQNDASTPGTIAIHALASSPDTGAIGVFGEASSTTSLNTTGVLGRSAAQNGYGVIGDATSPIGNVSGVYGSVVSPSGNGVTGIANSATGATRGVFGKVLSPDGHAGYFEGRGFFSDRVGIGTSNPAYALDVSSPDVAPSVFRAISGSTSGSTITLENESVGGALWNLTSSGAADPEGAGRLLVRKDTATSAPRLAISDNFVGIGRSTAIGAADFAIESDATGTNYGGMYINTPSATGKPFYGYAVNGGAEAWTYYDGTTASWRLFHAGAERVAVAATGNVGIGTTAPAFLLHVNGSAGKPGGGSWSNSSDRRLKTNIEDLHGSLEKLLALRGVTYEYKDPEAIHELPGRQIGVIAQEVEEVFPQWVDEGKDGMKRVTFRGFEALAVEALRELRAEKDAEIAAQRGRIESLETRVAQLEAMVETIALGAGAANGIRPASTVIPATAAAAGAPATH